jgi:hypothetical protein
MHPQFEVSVGSAVGKVQVGEQKYMSLMLQNVVQSRGALGTSGIWILSQTYPTRFSNAHSIILAKLQLLTFTKMLPPPTACIIVSEGDLSKWNTALGRARILLGNGIHAHKRHYLFFNCT